MFSRQPRYWPVSTYFDFVVFIDINGDIFFIFVSLFSPITEELQVSLFQELYLGQSEISLIFDKCKIILFVSSLKMSPLFVCVFNLCFVFGFLKVITEQ